MVPASIALLWRAWATQDIGDDILPRKWQRQHLSLEDSSPRLPPFDQRAFPNSLGAPALPDLSWIFIDHTEPNLSSPEHRSTKLPLSVWMSTGMKFSQSRCKFRCVVQSSCLSLRLRDGFYNTRVIVRLDSSATCTCRPHCEQQTTTTALPSKSVRLVCSFVSVWCSFLRRSQYVSLLDGLYFTLVRLRPRFFCSLRSLVVSFRAAHLPHPVPQMSDSLKIFDSKRSPWICRTITRIPIFNYPCLPHSDPSATVLVGLHLG